jgi:hypothetical protein
VAAWVRGTPPEGEGVERITVNDTFRLLGLTPPQTSTAAVVAAPPAADPRPFALIAAGIAGFLAGAWRGRRATTVAAEV